MALTPVTLAITNALPTVSGSVALTTADTTGFTFTKTDFPATWVTLFSEQDFYFHQTDAQTASATGNMQKVPAGTYYPIQVGTTRSLYMKCASGGTATVICTTVSHDG